MKHNLTILYHIVRMGHSWRIMNGISNRTRASWHWLSQYHTRYIKASNAYNESKQWLVDNGIYQSAYDIIAKKAAS